MECGALFELLNARIYVSQEEHQIGKRLLTRVNAMLSKLCRSVELTAEALREGNSSFGTFTRTSMSTVEWHEKAPIRPVKEQETDQNPGW